MLTFAGPGKVRIYWAFVVGTGYASKVGYMNEKPYRGQKVRSGSSIGVVIKMQGPHAVQVMAQYQCADQDFLTGKVTQISGFRKETWPIKYIQAVETTH